MGKSGKSYWKLFDIFRGNVNSKQNYGILHWIASSGGICWKLPLALALCLFVCLFVRLFVCACVRNRSLQNGQAPLTIGSCDDDAADGALINYSWTLLARCFKFLICITNFNKQLHYYSCLQNCKNFRMIFRSWMRLTFRATHTLHRFICLFGCV